MDHQPHLGKQLRPLEVERLSRSVGSESLFVASYEGSVVGRVPEYSPLSIWEESHTVAVEAFSLCVKDFHGPPSMKRHRFR